LLIKVMSEGKLTYKLPSIEEIRSYAAENLAKLPSEYKVLTNAPVYPVVFSVKLQKLIETVKQQITQNEINHVI